VTDKLLMAWVCCCLMLIAALCAFNIHRDGCLSLWLDILKDC